MPEMNYKTSTYQWRYQKKLDKLNLKLQKFGQKKESEFKKYKKKEY